MKNYKTYMVLIGFISTCAYAEEIPTSKILENKEVDFCLSQFGERNTDCIDSIREKSDSRLKELFNNKLKNISSSDYTQWWMGSKEQRDDIIKDFNASQNSWEAYKVSYCRAASGVDQNTHGYTQELISCYLNMNNRRIEEINLMN